jgi:hypothetical protein
VVLLLLALRNAWRYKGSFLWAVLAILWVSIPWEASSVERIWFYSPGIGLGWRILGRSVEEYALFVIDAATLSLLLQRGGRCADCSGRCPRVAQSRV